MSACLLNNLPKCQRGGRIRPSEGLSSRALENMCDEILQCHTAVLKRILGVRQDTSRQAGTSRRINNCVTGSKSGQQRVSPPPPTRRSRGWHGHITRSSCHFRLYVDHITYSTYTPPALVRAPLSRRRVKIPRQRRVPHKIGIMLA